MEKTVRLFFLGMFSILLPLSNCTNQEAATTSPPLLDTPPSSTNTQETSPLGVNETSSSAPNLPIALPKKLPAC